MALLGNLKGSAHVFLESEFYNGVATQSLRFDDDSSSHLSRTFVTPTNQNRWTLNAWVKRGALGARRVIIGMPYVNQEECFLGFDSNDNLEWQQYSAGGVTQINDLTTTAVFRDTASWYNIHAIFDSAGSGDDRQQLWVNGVKITSYGTESRSANSSVWNKATQVHYFGRRINGNYFDGYMSEINFVDGLALDPSYFGEFKDSIWIAKSPVVSEYGDNGFRLQFKNTGTSTTSEGTVASTNIGDDSSGKGHNFAVSGLSAHDCVPDSPENNFSVFTDISFPSTTDAIAEGGLRVGKTDQMIHASTFAFPTSGKWYWEVYSKSSNGSNYYMPYSGVCSTTFFHAEQDVGGNAGDGLFQKSGFSYIRGNDTKYKNLTSTSISDGATGSNEGTAGAEQGIAGFALDVDAGTLKYYWNNSLVRTDSTLTAGDEYFAFCLATNSGSNIWNYNYFNFGQDSSFAGTQTAQGNTDDNGIGDFYYSPQSGHLALSATNLPQPTIGPDSVTQATDHFNTVLYTGTGSTQSITGVGFQPDWVWTKQRNGTEVNALYDSSRTPPKVLYTSETNSEESNSGYLNQIDSDGFTVGSADLSNINSGTFVAWNWKANGGTTSSDSNGSITSTVQANTTAGFSIVLYTGTGANATVGHGLGAAPRWIIMKRRDADQNWVVYHEEVGNDRELILNTYDAPTGSNSVYFNNTSPTSTVFSLGSDNYANASSGTYVAYCFAEVEGYSKFGIYTANNSASDNAFVYTGFRPAFILVKGIQSGINQEWVIMDNKKSSSGGGNPIDSGSYPNYNFAEFTNSNHTDFLSNGFKVRATSGVGYYSGQDYIYAAFAEAPFKYANGR